MHFACLVKQESSDCVINLFGFGVRQVTIANVMRIVEQI